MLKRFITSLFCLFLIFASVPFLGHMDFLSVPVYADSVPTGFELANTPADTAESFNDYCKSRNAEFTSQLPNAMRTYVYNDMLKGANALGNDLDSVTSNLYKKTGSNGKVSWFLNESIMNFYNRLFQYLLDEQQISVGDTVDRELYSGKAFNDDDGNFSLVYTASALGDSTANLVKGTPYNRQTFLNVRQQFPNVGDSQTYTVHYNGTSFNYSLSRLSDLDYYTDRIRITGPSDYFNGYGMLAKQINKGYDNWYGETAVIYNTTDGNLYFGYLQKCYRYATSEWLRWERLYAVYRFPVAASDIAPDVSVNFVTINNQTINNNIQEGDTIINNDGDIEEEPTPGGQDPGWDVGGGQGSYNDGQGNNYTINFPDFELPDLNIDWSIQGLGNKFPFSIPFDIVSLVTVLNAEPEAPRFQGTVNFGFTTWDYDINLQQFDTVAQVCRIAELLLLVFGLILITRSIIKG